MAARAGVGQSRRGDRRAGEGVQPSPAWPCPRSDGCAPWRGRTPRPPPASQGGNSRARQGSEGGPAQHAVKNGWHPPHLQALRALGHGVHAPPPPLPPTVLATSASPATAERQADAHPKAHRGGAAVAGVTHQPLAGVCAADVQVEQAVAHAQDVALAAASTQGKGGAGVWGHAGMAAPRPAPPCMCTPAAPLP